MLSVGPEVQETPVAAGDPGHGQHPGRRDTNEIPWRHSPLPIGNRSVTPSLTSGKQEPGQQGVPADSYALRVQGTHTTVPRAGRRASPPGPCLPSPGPPVHPAFPGTPSPVVYESRPRLPCRSYPQGLRSRYKHFLPTHGPGSPPPPETPPRAPHLWVSCGSPAAQAVKGDTGGSEGRCRVPSPGGPRRESKAGPRRTPRGVSRWKLWDWLAGLGTAAAQVVGHLPWGDQSGLVGAGAGGGRGRGAKQWCARGGEGPTSEGTPRPGQQGPKVKASGADTDCVVMTA